jgi:DNA modification methylase
MTIRLLLADATRLPFADDSFDLVLGSPPYLDARTYGINAKRNLKQWIDWMLAVTAEAVRVSRGLVIWICAGVTRKWHYQPGPEGLLYRWCEQGGYAWRPAYWWRDGIPGSGGKQWLRANVEYALCFTKCKKGIPWADNTANGHPPKWAPGGEMSYRNSEGTRRNQWGSNHASDGRSKDESDVTKNNKGVRPSHKILTNHGRGISGGKGDRIHSPGPNRRDNGKYKMTRRCSRGHGPDGDTRQDDLYAPPVLANPGCLIKKIPVGGGMMGHKKTHANEAPYPLKLAQWFIRSWCPPNGSTYDPFIGSGTTCHAAESLGRNSFGSDLRFSQLELSRSRCDGIQRNLFDILGGDDADVPNGDAVSGRSPGEPRVPGDDREEHPPENSGDPPTDGGSESSGDGIQSP